MKSWHAICHKYKMCTKLVLCFYYLHLNSIIVYFFNNSDYLFIHLCISLIFMEQVAGIEPTSELRESSILAIVLHLHLELVIGVEPTTY